MLIKSGWKIFTSLFMASPGQNYHIFTPPGEKDWSYVWGCERWAKRLPWANSACKTDFKKSGDSGHLVLEFWITPFDYAPADNPDEAIPSDTGRK